MPNSAGLSGNDTLIINNRILTNLADADVIDLTFPNGIANLKVGKSGNTVFALNESGKAADMKFHLIRASADDKYFNGLLAAQMNNFSGTVLMIGEYIKKMGDGLGNIYNDTYILAGGIFAKVPEAKTNVEGNTDQSKVLYEIKWSQAARVIT